MNERLIALAVLAGCAFAGSAAAGMARDQYRTALEHAQGIYRQADDKCKPMKANARDICKVEAKGNYQVAKAELQARYKATPKNEDKLKTEKAQAAYRLAVEKCDDLNGAARQICKKDAKALLVAAQTEARLGRADIDKGLYSREAVREREKLAALRRAG